MVKDKEYAFGGHARKGLTGVYWTKPKFLPPGGTFRCEIAQGFTYSSEEEIKTIIHEVSQKFLGTKYNLLQYNCNTFTSELCERLTNKPAPSWLNRAASIGLALPCVVPREWISPPDHETAEGELLDEEEEEEEEIDDDEHAAMLSHSQRRGRAGSVRSTARYSTPPPRLVSVKDTSGREMPPSERAPMPRR